MENYKCACCEGNFISDRSKEEANQEINQQFQGQPLSEMALVCDDCYHQIMNFHEICTNGR